MSTIKMLLKTLNLNQKIENYGWLKVNDNGFLYGCHEHSIQKHDDVNNCGSSLNSCSLTQEIKNISLDSVCYFLT